MRPPIFLALLCSNYFSLSSNSQTKKLLASSIFCSLFVIVPVTLICLSETYRGHDLMYTWSLLLVNVRLHALDAIRRLQRQKG
jgi:hypothetical protein